MFVKLAPGAVKGNLQLRILPLKTWALTLLWEVLVLLFCFICTHTWPLQAGDHRGIPFQLAPELVTVISKGSPSYANSPGIEAQLHGAQVSLAHWLFSLWLFLLVQFVSDYLCWIYIKPPHTHISF